MFSQPLMSSSPLLLQWAIPVAGRFNGAQRTADASRDRWLAAFVARLGELRPAEDRETLLAIAADLWEDVGGHDPMIAAEMEHEAGLWVD